MSFQRLSHFRKTALPDAKAGVTGQQRLKFGFIARILRVVPVIAFGQVGREVAFYGAPLDDSVTVGELGVCKFGRCRYKLMSRELRDGMRFGF